MNESSVKLSKEQIDEIAERAAEVALERVYTSIGRSVVTKFLWAIGSGSIAILAWMNGAGYWPGSHK